MKRTFLLFFIFSSICIGSASAEIRFIQKVVDGNTLQLLDGDRVRLIGVDIPSDGEIAKGAVMTPTQQRASDYVRSLVSGSLVELRFDEAKRDAEGYLLAYVWFPYPEQNFMESLEFRNEVAVDKMVDRVDEELFLVFLNASVIKAGYASPAELSADEANTEHSALFQNIFANGSVETARVE